MAPFRLTARPSVLALFTVLVLATLGLSSCGGGAGAQPVQTPPPSAPTVSFSAASTTLAAGASTTIQWDAQNATAVSISPDPRPLGSGPLPMSGTLTVKPSGTTTYTLIATGSGGTATRTVVVAVTAPAPLASLSVTPVAITAGSSAVLQWQTQNATSVTLSPDPRPQGSPALSINDSLTVSPTATTTYTLTATGAGGSVTATATVSVTSAPPVVSISATPTSITAGSISSLTWSTQNATTVTITPDPRPEPTGPMPFSSSLPVTPNATTTYVLTATGPGGNATASATVSVTQPPPAVTLTTDPASIVAGASATLSWSAQNATSLLIDHGVGAVTVPTGSVSIAPTATTTYTATATGPGGNASGTATLTVTPPAQVGVTLTATPDTVSAGQPVTLAWTSQNAASVAITPGVGAVAASGQRTVTPTATTTYTATATDIAGKTATSAVTVNVSQAGDLQTKIKHIIFFVQENRSFDNYFGKLGAYRLAKGVTTAADGDIDAFSPTVQLKDKSGRLVSPFHYRTICTENLSPQWNESHTHWDNGAMDGYMLTTLASTIDPNGHRAIGYYDQRDLPYYYELATQFATTDSMFAPVMSNTIPNRMYLFTATSFGHTIPDPFTAAGQYNQKTIFDLLSERGIGWRYYYQDNGIFLFQFATWTNNNGAAQSNVFPIANWYSILADPNADNLLPPVIFIERATPTGLDEHPGENVQTGVANTKQIIDALMRSTAWQSSIFILTYDEGGAVYDHVPPLTVPAPDNIPPMLKPGDKPGDFTLTGFRVPFMVLSPWVKKSYVSHVPRDLTSILKLIETRFGLPPLTARDAWADPMLDFFDFTQASWLTPPQLPDQPVNGVCDKTLEAGP